VSAVAEKIGSAFNIKKGEFVPIFALFLYLLFIIASYTASKAVRDALYLSKFGALKLPYVYIGIAVLVGVFVAAYIKIGRYFRQHTLIGMSLAFFAGNVLLFWTLLQFGHQNVLYPVIYIWGGIFGVIGPMQVWTLSNLILTTREAKRLYGFLGAGGVLGGITGGFVASALAPRIGTENLLLVIAGFLVICVGLVYVVWQKSKHKAEKLNADPARAASSLPRNLRQSIRIIAGSRYLLLIAAIISIASIATTVIDYQFKAVAETSINSRDQLTVFFGNFYGYLGIAAFLLQLFLTGRMMKKLGIGFTIFLLPLGLVMGSAALLTFMSLWAAVLLKAPDQLFKHSVDKSTIELLYLPVPSDIKPAVKSFIDTIVWRLADGVAGILLLVLTTWLSFSVRQVTYVNLGVIAMWLAIAYWTKREYLEALRAAISRREVDLDRMTIDVQVPSTMKNIIASLKSPDTREVLYGLHLLTYINDQKPLVPHLVELLQHESADVRAQAIALLAEVGDPRLTVKVQRLLEDESPMVQERAIEFVCAYGADEHVQAMRSFLESDDYNLRVAAVCCAVSHDPAGELPNQARAVLEEMLHNPDANARREAARALGQFPCPASLTGSIARLLGDSDSEVVRQAVQTAARLRRPELLPQLLEKTADRRVGPAARAAVAAYGPEILPMLREKLLTPNGHDALRRAVPQVISLIGTQEAVDMLGNALPQPDPKLRLAIIKGLNKLRSRHPELRFDREQIRRQLLAEMKELYRAVLLYHGYSGLVWRPHQEPPANGDLLKSALAERAAAVLERISRLFGLLYEPEDLSRVYYGVTHASHTVRANALELLDNLLEPEDKRLVFPIIDDESTHEQRLHRAEELGLREFARSDALAEILRSDDSLLVLCAMDAVQAQDLNALEAEIARATRHMDPMVRETAAKVYASLRA